jgi:hypothetical protein
MDGSRSDARGDKNYAVSEQARQTSADPRTKPVGTRRKKLWSRIIDSRAPHWAAQKNSVGGDTPRGLADSSRDRGTRAACFQNPLGRSRSITQTTGSNAVGACWGLDFLVSRKTPSHCDVDAGALRSVLPNPMLAGGVALALLLDRGAGRTGPRRQAAVRRELMLLMAERPAEKRIHWPSGAAHAGILQKPWQAMGTQAGLTRFRHSTPARPSLIKRLSDEVVCIHKALLWVI